MGGRVRLAQPSERILARHRWAVAVLDFVQAPCAGRFRGRPLRPVTTEREQRRVPSIRQPAVQRTGGLRSTDKAGICRGPALNQDQITTAAMFGGVIRAPFNIDEELAERTFDAVPRLPLAITSSLIVSSTLRGACPQCRIDENANTALRAANRGQVGCLTCSRRLELDDRGSCGLGADTTPSCSV